jgi:hypothetical protein
MCQKQCSVGWVRWLMSVIPATLEAEMGRIRVPGQILPEK